MDTSIRIIPAMVGNPLTKKGVNVNVVLDDCCNRSFIDKKLYNRLQLVGYDTRIVLRGLGNETIDEYSKIVEIELFSTGPLTFQGSIFVKVLNHALDEAMPIDWNIHKKNWNHLKNLEFPPCFDNARHAELIIGSDYPNFQRSLQELPGKNDLEPYARKTCLGWTAVGPIFPLSYHQEDEKSHKLSNANTRSLPKTNAIDAKETNEKSTPKDASLENQKGNSKKLTPNMNRSKPKQCRLRIIPAFVTNPITKKGVKVNVLLDDGFSQSMISNQLSKRLDLTGYQSSLSVRGIRAEIEEKTCEIVKIGLMKTNRSFHTEIYVKTIERMIDNAYPVDWNNHKRKWPHLRHLDFPDQINISKRAEIIIGCDYPNLMESIIEKPGQNDLEPFARLTCLGWTAVGLLSPHLNHSINEENTIIALKNKEENENQQVLILEKKGQNIECIDLTNELNDTIDLENEDNEIIDLVSELETTIELESEDENIIDLTK